MRDDNTVVFWPDELPPGFLEGGRGLIVPDERVEEMRRSIEHEQAARMALELAVAEANKFTQLAVMERMAAFEQILRPLGIDLRDSEGINYDPENPGFKNILMHPRAVPGLTFAKGALDSPQGKIISSWQAREGKFSWAIVVPPNATATVYIPTRDSETVRESGKPTARADGVTFLRLEGDSSVYAVGSGNYEFTCALPQR